jgi:hypothetical protein
VAATLVELSSDGLLPWGGAREGIVDLDGVARPPTGWPDVFEASIALRVLAMLVGVVWLAVSWACVPRARRRMRRGRSVSVGQVVGLLFVPCFNVYWVFAVNIGLCNAMNRVLAGYDSEKRAPVGVAVAACVVHFGSSVAALAVPQLSAVAPFLWFVYMLQTDVAKRVMLVCIRDAPTVVAAPARSVALPPVADERRAMSSAAVEDYDARLDAELKDLDRP